MPFFFGGEAVWKGGRGSAKDCSQDATSQAYRNLALSPGLHLYLYQILLPSPTSLTYFCCLLLSSLPATTSITCKTDSANRMSIESPFLEIRTQQLEQIRIYRHTTSTASLSTTRICPYTMGEQLSALLFLFFRPSSPHYSFWALTLLSP